ncbi:MAG: response regulator [Anaerolineae bacterium]|nr:response regulator [Anaerolineae bacterium]
MTLKKIIIAFVTTLWLVWIPGIDILAQEPDIRFEYVFDLGAPGLQTFIQDQEGFLWIGSKNGLFRYDGYELRHYGTGPGKLSNGYIYGLVEDPVNPQILWIGTKEGLNRFDKKTETYTYYQHKPDDPTSLVLNGINIILPDTVDSNLIWIGTDGGLDRFDKQSATFTHYKADPDNPRGLLCPQVWRIIADATDPTILWIGTWGCGVHKFNKDTGEFTSYTYDPDTPGSLAAEDNIITAITQDRDNSDTLWIGTVNSGLAQFNKHTGEFLHYTHNPQDPTSIPDGVISLIYDDGNGKLWLGGWVADNGLTLFDKETGIFTNYKHEATNSRSLSEDQIVNIYRDRSNIIWIVSSPGKVDKFDPWAQNFSHYQHTADDPNSLVHNSVTVIQEGRNGAIWLGTQRGLAKFNTDTEDFTNYTYDPNVGGGLPADYVWDIEQGPRGNLWISHFPGPLIHFDPRSGKVIDAYTAGVESFLEIIQDPHDKNTLWVLSRPPGLGTLDKTTGEFTFYEDRIAPEHLDSDENTMYVGIHDRQEETIWLGGWEGGGLNRFDKQSKTFKHYMADPNAANSLSVNAIGTLYQDTSGTLWLGTLGGGLEKFNKDSETFTHYADEYNIPAVINGIAEDNDRNLWLSTDSGLIKFDPKSERVLQHYTKSDGLQGDAFLPNSALKTSAGELWFGGTNGVNRCDPDKLINNSYIPPVVLTSFTQGGDPVRANTAPQYVQDITLNWQNNFFEFEYAALNYTRPEKNQYAYMLEGVDKDWYTAGTQRFGRYTGLPPGHYTLRIQGSNNDGVWNEQGVALGITITPPFWNTGWFQAVTVTGVLGIVGVVVWAQIQKLQAERAKAEALQKSEEQLQAQMRRIQQIINTVPEGVLLLKADGHISVKNPEADRCLEILHANFTDKPVTKLGDQPLTTLLTSPPTKGLWHEVKFQDSTFEVIARPMQNKSQSEDWVLVLRNVTQEREIQEQIQQQERLASVGQLAAGIAHDFNNIMATIILYAQMAARGNNVPEQAKEKMYIIDQQAKHAAQLIEQILDFSRRSLLERQPLNLLPLVKEHVQILKRTLPENIEISLGYERGEYIVKADPTRIQQMLTNLAINARDAMPDGGNLQITLEPRCVNRGNRPPLPDMALGNWIQITVTDTGTGMPPEILSRIFDPFYTTKERGKGHGLGLAQVHGIVGTHEGYIDVKSQVGQGSQFIIYLPALQGQEPEPVNTRLLGYSPGNREIILVIEDHREARQAILESLELLNYQVLTAENGRDALDLLDDHHAKVDLILSDVVMPTMGGLALAHAIQERGISTKILLMTGHPLDQELTNLQDKNIIGWLTKPLNLNQLAEAISRALQEEG